MRPTMQSWIDANSARDPQAARPAAQIRLWIEELHEGEYADAAACKPGLAVAAAPAPVAVGCADPTAWTRPASCARRASSTSLGTAMTC